MEMVESSCFERKFEYIRIRLYLMASLPDFFKLTKERVHLYSETSFIKKMCEELKINKRKFSQYYKIAKSKLMIIEDPKNEESYRFLIKSYIEEFEIDVEVLPSNYVLLGSMLEEYKE